MCYFYTGNYQLSFVNKTLYVRYNVYKGVDEMNSTNITNFSMSQDDYNNLIETIAVLSNPEMKPKIIDGKNTALKDCVPESEDIW